MQLLTNGKQQFIDQNGAPLAGGQVYHYSPGTTNALATYKDQAGQSANTNPILLDSRGQAVIWGNGTYRQVVTDAAGNQLWDQVVAAPQSALGYTPYDAANPAGYISAQAAAGTYMPLAGGTITGPVVLKNSIGLYGTETSGTTHEIIGLAADNNVYTFMGSGGYYFWYNSAGNNVAILDSTGALSSRKYTGTSDETLKTDWVDLGGLAFVRKLAKIKRTGAYRWKDTGEWDAGAGAQSWRRILPQVVSKGADKKLRLNQGGAAIAAVGELAKAHVQLVEEVEALRRLVAKLGLKP